MNRNRTWLLSLLTVLAGTLCTGCVPKAGPLTAVAPVSDRPRVGNVYLLRGFIGVFSTGIDSLGEKINGQGVRAIVYQDDQWSSLADKIAKEYRARPDHEPIVLVGHSYGADDAVRIAKRLEEAKIPVDLVVTLDPVTPPALPKNVRTCVNLYQSNGVMDSLPWLRGIPLTRAEGSVSVLINSNIRTDRPDLWDAPLDHFNIEKKSGVHDEVVKRLKEVCVPRAQWAAQRQLLPPVVLIPPQPESPKRPETHSQAHANPPQSGSVVDASNSR